MKLLLLVLISIAYVAADDVVDLGDSDFENKLADMETALVMFYAPWCGHCKRLKPEFEKASSILLENDPPIHLVKVDCTEAGKEICSKFGVSGYPTIKIFRKGELSSDYNGPRELNGIVKFMKSQVGPSSKELTSLDEAKKFIAKNEVAVVYFGEGSLKDAFLKLADKLRESVRFGHTSDKGVSEEYGVSEDSIVLFRPSLMANKFEPSTVAYEGAAEASKIEQFVRKSFHGLAGHRTQDNAGDFNNPLVVAYYEVDYGKNAKGTNYWRNRVLKVAQNFKEDFSFAVSSKDDFAHEFNEFGIDFTKSDKPIVLARDAKEQKYVMKEGFAMDTFEAFLNDFKSGKLVPYLKSEEAPDNSDADVKVAVAKNFDELVTNSGRDALLEFYAPWCGHCKKLTPIFDELGEMLRGEDVDIIKMDATANDVPPEFNVKGFPTLYWRPASQLPVAYNGGRELDDFVKYIAEHSTDELKGYTREGKAKKSEL